MQPAPTLPVIEYAERSDPGRDPEKQVNEDACGHRETRFGHLCVVCDGMGGHASGREAAELALGTIFEVFETAPDGTAPGGVLKAAIEEASRRVARMPTDEVALGRPGATCVAVLLHARGTEVAHVGDSRAYLAHEGQVFRLTRDHSVVQEMVDRGLLTPQQAAHHPDANRITRALGMSDELDAELRPEPVHQVPGDVFVLCSDGLSDLVEDAEILAIVAGDPAAQAAGKLVDLANARGGHDNVTVVVLRAREAAFGVGTALPPTVAQTSVPRAQATVPLAAVPALDVAHGDRATQHILPGPAVLPPAPEPPPPPSSGAVGPRRASPAVAVGIVLALLAVALLGTVVVLHLQERKGKNHGSAPLNFPMSDAQPPAAVTPIAPASVVVPTASTSAEPIAPLEPAVPAPTKGKR